ncbi:DUF3810 domain-containing protein [uncultured Bacteroides sp.]|jgi:hypothetical protein|uniref:DUF3810 domain-containing protein n=1 Tax=uncultured Bacteroides sp. TaxID=162156 RepID=UPI00280A8F51|nr:DUF3810 domain-containing protein [uncultured Bacteroides sp.]
MKRFSAKYWRWGVWAALFIYIAVCRYIPSCGEWYACHVYPVISIALSALVSFIPFSLEEVLVVSVVLFLAIYPCYARRRKVAWWIVIRRELEILVGMYCWFYVGWGMNYYRHDFFTRSGIQPLAYDSVCFHRFVTGYIERLNDSRVPDVRFDCDGLEKNVKQLYGQISDGFGLSDPQSWQHPKRVLFNPLYSGVGVLGYMGPFFAESQLNTELPPVQYPFTYAHEYAHLLGVSSEAEANFWAYQVCTRSSSGSVRYSGYFGLLPYVLINARSVLNEQTYRKLFESISPEVRKDLVQTQEYWQVRYSPLVGKIQDVVYSWYLKGNKISSGQKNYSEVIGMIISLPEHWW